MPKSFLEKYYDDNNPVLDRLNIVKKILIRLIILIVCTIWFLSLYVANSNNIFSDVSPELLIFVYIAMGLSALISLGITIRPRSSTLLTMPVAFIYLSPSFTS